MKHFILKNEIIITLIIKKRGGGENYNFQCYLFLNSNILHIWREYPMTYFTKQKTLGTSNRRWGPSWSCS